MVTLMRFLLIFSLLGFFLRQFSLYGFVHPEPDHLALQTDYLYLYPAIEQRAFAVLGENDDPNFVVGKRVSNQPSFHSGVRARLLYGLNSCWDVGGNFVYYRASTSREVATSDSNPILYPTIIGANGLINSQARAHVTLTYYAGEVTGGYFLLNEDPIELVFIGGFHACSVNCVDNFQVTGTTATGGFLDNFNTQSRSRFWGVGPELGFDFDYMPSCIFGLALEGSLRGSILVTEMRTKFAGEQLFTNLLQQTIIENDAAWHVNPGFQASLGLNYKWCICSFEAAIAGGYNLIWYHNAVNSIEFENFFHRGQSRDFYQDFILHGPYVSLQVQF